MVGIRRMTTVYAPELRLPYPVLSAGVTALVTRLRGVAGVYGDYCSPGACSIEGQERKELAPTDIVD